MAMRCPAIMRWHVARIPARHPLQHTALTVVRIHVGSRGHGISAPSPSWPGDDLAFAPRGRRNVSHAGKTMTRTLGEKAIAACSARAGERRAQRQEIARALRSRGLAREPCED